MKSAAIYCRSSKDRAEIGLDAQRKELREFAKRKGYAITAEYSDMEISGSLDEVSRPGLRALLQAARDPDRSWDVLLTIDTSRIGRDSMVAVYVTRELEKHGIRIEYAKMPIDGSSAFGETMLNVVRAFDRFHSRISAEKGRDGMAANVAKGFRAGGRAPLGYILKHEETGGVRNGVRVRKSRLVPDPESGPKVRAFLKARAAGVARTDAAKAAHLKKPVASLIGIERNALTYSGFTVWNQRKKIKPSRENPFKTMHARPRSEWVVSERPTHKALITRQEAEKVLALHAERTKPRIRIRKPETFILSGLLFAPGGAQWHGDAHDKAYRAGMKGKRVNAPWLESQIIYRVAYDFADPKFLARTVKEARRMAAGIETDPGAIEKELRRAERQLTNLLDLAAQGDTKPKALLDRIRTAEERAAELRNQKSEWVERARLKESLLAIDESEIRGIIAASGLELRDGPGMLDLCGFDQGKALGSSELRRILEAVVERIELDPATRAFKIRYRLPVTGVKLASPRGLKPNSGEVVRVVSVGWLPRRKARSAGRPAMRTVAA